MTLALKSRRHHRWRFDDGAKNGTIPLPRRRKREGRVTTCDHAGFKALLNRRTVGENVIRSFRCHKCKATWRTVECLYTRAAIERAYISCMRIRRKDVTRVPSDR